MSVTFLCTLVLLIFVSFFTYLGILLALCITGMAANIKVNVWRMKVRTYIFRIRALIRLYRRVRGKSGDSVRETVALSLTIRRWTTNHGVINYVDR